MIKIILTVVVLVVLTMTSSIFAQSKDSTSNTTSSKNTEIKTVISTIENYYGYTLDGTFFCHKSMGDSLGSSDIPLLITRVVAKSSTEYSVPMELEGDWYVYHSGKKMKKTEKYCFDFGGEFIPYVFASEWDHDMKEYTKFFVKEGDITEMNKYGGYDFKTGPREMR